LRYKFADDATGDSLFDESCLATEYEVAADGSEDAAVCGLSTPCDAVATVFLLSEVFSYNFFFD
jgi:hypothetical protein